MKYLVQTICPCSYYVHAMSLQEFDDPRDADDAVYELNGRELLGERCVEFLRIDFGVQF